ncbi:hypothetical protein EVAR_66234_1 [Eumeta japonica]|uniref:Uncharacterized protein n=1 Tax=Eumeta variegata TaxID=151549 RepID=A0A4C1ZY46_EUMVA|nr:hypothetical protein EVAR_66234_1 [Eumeta japonica]
MRNNGSIHHSVYQLTASRTVKYGENSFEAIGRLFVCPDLLLSIEHRSGRREKRPEEGSHLGYPVVRGLLEVRRAEDHIFVPVLEFLL